MTTENIAYAMAAVMLLFAYFIRLLALKGKIRMNQGYRFRNVKPAFLATYYSATIIPLSIMEIVGMFGTALFLADLCRPRKEELEALAGERIFDIQSGFSPKIRT